MKKHTYRAKNVNQINWPQLKDKLSGGPAVLALDIAKTKQYALLTTDAGLSVSMYWEHPTQTRDVLSYLTGLDCPISVVLEPTGTYGDAIRYQLRCLGFDMYQMDPKRVFDAKSVYDGVDSLHDGKSVVVITNLYRLGLCRRWQELTETEREMDALRKEYDLYQDNYQRQQNQLEAILSRHWPEILQLLALDSVVLEGLLIEFGTPGLIAQNIEAAIQLIKSQGKGFMKDEKIQQIIASAVKTLGQPCLIGEQRYLQTLAAEMQHNRLQRKSSKKELEKWIQSDDGLKEMADILGLITTAIFMSCRLDPRHFAHPQSFLKALGLNLKEKSSGRYQGQLKITKRGCSIVRRYLYFAALRLIRNNPLIKAWYQAKVHPKYKKKTIVALMRKLGKALWHISRGARFDAAKLVTVA
jgi:transposase